MHAFFVVLYEALNLYLYCLIAAAILSWLISFDVINRRNQAVYRIYDFLRRLTDPALAPIRRVVPLIGGVDISPIVLFFLIRFAMTFIADHYLLFSAY